MDDGVIFAENLEDITNMTNRLYRVCLKYGLNLNKNKCKILIINDKENIEIEKIGEINVAQNIKYLGVIIDNKKKMFQISNK